MVQLVNGYACHNSADAALARRGIDPAAARRPAAAPAPSAPTSPASMPARASAPGSLSGGGLPVASSPGGAGEQPATAALRRGQILDLIA